MNEYDLKATVFVAAMFLVGIVIIVWLIRKRVSNVSIKAGTLRAKVKAHETKGTSVKDLEQISADGGNEIKINKKVSEVAGVSQRGRGDNNLTIGGD
jgi:membrane protein implicated in regulation of membrane protease activity